MNRSELYLAFLPVLNSGRLELLDNPRMVAQFVGLERRAARSGKDSVDHAQNSHDDVSNSVAGVVSLLSAGQGANTGMLEFYRREYGGGGWPDEIQPRDRVVAPDELVALQATPWQEFQGWTGKSYRGHPETGIILVDPLDAPGFERAGFHRVESKE